MYCKNEKCKKWFAPNSDRQKYCCSACQIEQNHTNWRNKKVWVVCSQCGEEYKISLPNYSKNNKRLCYACRRGGGPKPYEQSKTLEPEMKLQLRCPTTNSWKSLSLSPESKDWPGLVFPAGF